MTKDEVLRLALEALETSMYPQQKQLQAITAIKSALEAKDEPVAWEGGESWESLAWQLCADECGEEACTELIWEGGPNPEPWGDRWMKYEEEAKRLIALVRKHTTPPQRTWVGLTDDEIIDRANNEVFAEAFARGVAWTEAKLKEKNT